MVRKEIKQGRENQTRNLLHKIGRALTDSANPCFLEVLS